MTDRAHHLLHHDPHDTLSYVRSCPHCRLERRLLYGNGSRNGERNLNPDARRIVESLPQRLPARFRRLVNRRVQNQTRRSRETYLEYNQDGQIDGFQVIEPITRNRYIVEHYILTNGPGNHWYLDGLLITTGEELNGDHPPVHEAFSDVIVYTSVYHLNKNTNLKRLGSPVELNHHDCVICLESLEKDQILREIKGCNHHYHQKCLDVWAETNHRCPLCNFDFAE